MPGSEPGDLRFESLLGGVKGNETPREQWERRGLRWTFVTLCAAVWTNCGSWTGRLLLAEEKWWSVAVFTAPGLLVTFCSVLRMLYCYKQSRKT